MMWKSLRKVSIAALMIAASVLVCLGTQSSLLEVFAGQEEGIRECYRQAPWLTAACLFIGYALIMAFPSPLSVPATLFCGWMIGAVAGCALVSFASTLAASLTFVIGRGCLANWKTDRLGPLLERLKNRSTADMSCLLFAIRLTPGIPFFVVNLGFGLSSIPLWRFWVISQLGMLPATALYTYMGSQLPHLDQLREHGVQGAVSVQLLIGLALLGSTPFILRFARRLLRLRQAERLDDLPDQC